MMKQINENVLFIFFLIAVIVSAAIAGQIIKFAMIKANERTEKNATEYEILDQWEYYYESCYIKGYEMNPYFFNRAALRSQGFCIGGYHISENCTITEVQP